MWTDSFRSKRFSLHPLVIVFDSRTFPALPNRCLVSSQFIGMKVQVSWTTSFLCRLLMEQICQKMYFLQYSLTWKHVTYSMIDYVFCMYFSSIPCVLGLPLRSSHYTCLDHLKNIWWSINYDALRQVMFFTALVLFRWQEWCQHSILTHPQYFFETILEILLP
jgi:hypothetical protein